MKSLSFRCSECGYSVGTSGPWHFILDEHGNRNYLKTPPSDSEPKAPYNGVGSYAHMYCSTCDETYGILLSEVIGPRLGRMPESLRNRFELARHDGLCPICGDDATLLHNQSGDTHVLCPHCNKGTFHGEVVLMT